MADLWTIHVCPECGATGDRVDPGNTAFHPDGGYCWNCRAERDIEEVDVARLSALEQKEAELERLQVQVKGWKANYSDELHRAEQAEADLERLREGLSALATGVEMVRDGMALVYSNVEPDAGPRAHNMATCIRSDHDKLGYLVLQARSSLLPEEGE